MNKANGTALEYVLRAWRAHEGELFAQLALPNQQHDTYQSLTAHALLACDFRLSKAAFWAPMQATFLQKTLDQDADWTELVGHLDKALCNNAGAR